ncbi:MAG: EscU/YscU/HrcU family type III secretion system export apparatus switch protein, partial [bacterium]
PPAARRRMSSEVPKADVVITNPIHLAVAGRYDPGGSRAPMVVAKGARLVAERIKEEARRHLVPVFEDPPLAQALFPIAVGAELPAALYQAVAKVLAFVYHANRKEKEKQVLGDLMERRMREAAARGG